MGEASGLKTEAVKSIVFSAGGTGGHIYPAIAVADRLKQRYERTRILFVGTKRGMESSLVPEAGYDIEYVSASGIDRKRPWRNIKTLGDMYAGSRMAKRILEDFSPSAVVGTGGYVTATVIREAAKLNIPSIIQEQNAVAGLANKLLAGYASKIFVGFPQAAENFKNPSNVVFSGNPVRRAFLTVSGRTCRDLWGIGPEEFALLIFGGSLGAENLNLTTLSACRRLAGRNIKVFFITGRRYFEDIKALISAESDMDFVHLIDYEKEMHTLMAACDLVVSRAGGIAISELAALSKPSVLVPSPNVTGNHQYYNAKAYSDAGGAVLLSENELSADRLADIILRLAASKEKLNAMGESAFKWARPDATDVICDEIAKIAKL